MSETLNNYDLCVDTSDSYKYYLQDLKDSSGKCFGASLYWAADVLREIANDKKTVGFTLENTNKFYDFSSHVQKVYTSICNRLGEDSYGLIVETLNKQEELLKTNYKLYYSRLNGASARTRIGLMIKNNPLYRNCAMVLSTRLINSIKSSASHENKYYAHATALLNYEGKIFLFDVNRGIYEIKRDFSCNQIIKTICSTFRLDGVKDNAYVLSEKYRHIFIALKQPSSVDKKITTRNHQPYIG